MPAGAELAERAVALGEVPLERGRSRLERHRPRRQCAAALDPRRDVEEHLLLAPGPRDEDERLATVEFSGPGQEIGRGDVFRCRVDHGDPDRNRLGTVHVHVRIFDLQFGLEPTDFQLEARRRLSGEAAEAAAALLRLQRTDGAQPERPAGGALPAFAARADALVVAQTGAAGAHQGPGPFGVPAGRQFHRCFLLPGGPRPGHGQGHEHRDDKQSNAGSLHGRSSSIRRGTPRVNRRGVSSEVSQNHMQGRVRTSRRPWDACACPSARVPGSALAVP